MQLPEFRQAIKRLKIFQNVRPTTSNTFQNLNKLAVRGTEVFYAVDNVVRCGSLNSHINFKVRDSLFVASVVSITNLNFDIACLLFVITVVVVF